MIVLDIEGSGRNYCKCSMISLGAIYLDEPEKQFYKECKVWDGAEIEENVLTAPEFQFKREDMTDPNHPTPTEVLEEFGAWIAQFPVQVIAGKSITYDLAMIENQYRRDSREMPFSYRWLDLNTLVYFKYLEVHKKPLLKDKSDGVNMKNTLEFCGLEDNRTIHNALEDAKLTAECFSRIVKGKKLLPEYEKYQIPKHLNRD